MAVSWVRDRFEPHDPDPLEANEIVELFKQVIANEMRSTPDQIDEETSFYNLGLNSLTSVYVLEELEKKLGMELNPMFFFDYPTIREFSDFIASKNFQK